MNVSKLKKAIELSRMTKKEVYLCAAIRINICNSTHTY